MGEGFRDVPEEGWRTLGGCLAEAWSMLEDQDIWFFGGHPDSRAGSTISTSLEPISAAGRTGGLPKVNCCKKELSL